MDTNHHSCTSSLVCGRPHGKTKLSDAQVAQIARDYVSGATMAQLAKAHNVSQTPIASALRRTGTPLRAPGPQKGSQGRTKLSDAQAAQIARDYVSGATMAQLAKAYNVHWYTVSRLLRRTGTPSRQGRTKLSATQVAQIARRYAAGATVPELAKAHNVSKTTIYRVCREASLVDVSESPKCQGAEHE